MWKKREGLYEHMDACRKFVIVRVTKQREVEE